MSVTSHAPAPPPTVDSEAAVKSPNRPTRTWKATGPYRPVMLLTIGLVIYVSITQGTFLTSENIQNLLTAVAVLWIISLGQTFVLITGGADLSSAAIATFITILVAKTFAHLPDGVEIPIAIFVGAAVGGFTNGWLIGKLGLSFFVVTLATSTALGGVITLWSGGNSFTVNSSVINALSINTIAGVDTPIWIMAGVFVAALYMQRRTYFGRNLYAIGGSRTAARLAGIRTERSLVQVYALVGACAGFAGILEIGLAGSATPQVDPTLALLSVAAVLLGGTSLFGGSGSVVGTAMGVLFIGVLQNGLDLSGVPSAWQSVITGVILIVAVAAIPGSSGRPRLMGMIARAKTIRSTSET